MGDRINADGFFNCSLHRHGCRNVWMVPGGNCSQRLRHQQDWSNVMVCGEIKDGKVVI